MDVQHDVNIRLLEDKPSEVSTSKALHVASSSTLGLQIFPQKVFGPSWHPPQSHLLRCDWSPNGEHISPSSCSPDMAGPVTAELHEDAGDHRIIHLDT